MTIINIRGTSGSGKSTLVKRYLKDNEGFVEEITGQMSDWKKPKVIAYEVKFPHAESVFIVGPYKTQCGGCDALSYKGSHEDMEKMVRTFAEKGDVIFEGLTISSTVSRWQGISNDYPGQFIWAFMMTPEEECHQRILSRNGGREPKVKNGLADYQIKYRGCMRHLNTLKEQGERTLELLSNDVGYTEMLEALN